MTSFDLTDRVALVTGGGRGLGRAMALALGGAGAHVAVSSRTESELAETVDLAAQAGAEATAIPCDLGQQGDAARLVDEAAELLGRVDVLVHAAGNQVRSPALTLGLEDWDEIHRIHLRAGFLLAQRTADHIIDRRGTGSIILVGSLTSWRVGVPDTVAYGSAKSGLLGLMRTLAVEWAEHGVRVNTIAPGFFATEMTADVADDPDRRALLARIPMGRQGEPEELSGAVVYLASDASAYVTGQVLTVDGGWTVA